MYYYLLLFCRKINLGVIGTDARRVEQLSIGELNTLDPLIIGVYYLVIGLYFVSWV